MRLKRASKRRWIARFRLGQDVPYKAFVEYPDLHKKLTPIVWCDYAMRGRAQPEDASRKRDE